MTKETWSKLLLNLCASAVFVLLVLTAIFFALLLVSAIIAVCQNIGYTLMGGESRVFL